MDAVLKPLYRTPSALAVLAALTLWRVAILAADAPNLSFDEAQYWAWAQQVQFGYYSKPPLVAWVIAATTSLCGDGEACVKVGSSLAYFVASAAVYALGRTLYDAGIGFWSALAFATLPAVSLSSMVISTDPFLLLFWALALLCLVKAVDDGGLHWWLALGAAIGFGLLAKYAMVLFLLSLALYLAWSPERRGWFKDKRLYGALGVALLVYLPNLAWNATNGFVSYAHTKDNANLGGALLQPGKLLEFIAAQFGVMGPILFAALLALVFIRFSATAKEDRGRLLLAFILPILAIMTAQAFLSRANANWAAPAFVSGTVLTVAWLARAKFGPALLRLSVLLHLAAAAALYNYDVAAKAAGLADTARFDPMKRVRGWDEVGRQVSAILSRNPGAVLLSDERKVLATLTYYVTPHPFDAVKWNPSGLIHDHFDQTTDIRRAASGTFIYVSDEARFDEVAARFHSAETVAVIRIPIHRDYTREVRVYRLAGFKGY